MRIQFFPTIIYQKQVPTGRRFKKKKNNIFVSRRTRHRGKCGFCRDLLM